MKLVKKSILALVLATGLAVSASGGEQSTPGFAAPTPTPTPDSVMIISDDGTVVYDSNPESTETDTSDNLLLEALAALLSMY